MRTIIQRLHRIVCQLHVFLRFLRFYLHTCLATILTGFAHCLSLLHVIVGLYTQCLGITGQSAFWTQSVSHDDRQKLARTYSMVQGPATDKNVYIVRYQNVVASTTILLEQSNSIVNTKPLDFIISYHTSWYILIHFFYIRPIIYTI